jgi:hypothetical protein
MEDSLKNKVVFDFQSYHTPTTKSMYYGVFLGFVSALTCLAYWSFAINVLQLTMSSYVVNIQTIAFGAILPLVVFGILHAILFNYFKGAGSALASVIFALAVIWLIIVIARGDYGDTPPHITQFKELVIPLVSIIGIMGAIVFPICYKSEKMANLIL